MGYFVAILTLIISHAIGLFGAGYFLGRLVHDERSKPNEIYLVGLYLISALISGSAMFYALLWPRLIIYFGA